MRTRSLIRVLLLLAAGWILITFNVLLTQWTILENAGGYRPAEFRVEGSHCIDVGSENSYTNCFLTGSVLAEGKRIAGEYFVGSTVPADYRAGSQFAIFYNHAMPAFGITNYNLRILRSEGDSDAAAAARRKLWANLRVILFSLVAAVVLHIALRMGVRRLSNPPRKIAIDVGGGPAGVGLALCAFGLSFLAGPSLDFRLLLCGIGAPMFIRRFLVLSKDDGLATSGFHFFGYAFRQQSEPLAQITMISVEGVRKSSFIVMSGEKRRESIRKGEPYAANLKTASQLATFYGASLRSESDDAAPTGLPRKTLRTLFAAVVILLQLSLPVTMVVLAIGGLPSSRLSFAISALDPFNNYLRQTGFLRRWSLDQLVNDTSPETVLELLRLVNTVDAARFPELAADMDAAVMRRSGLVPLSEQDREAHLRAVNVWASSYLHKPLDENGGVLGWLPVSERFVDLIDTINSGDLHQAWLAWEHFGAGDLTSPEQFLYAVGPALGDTRPIYFSIVRSAASFEGQPVPIDSRPGALAHTVGEALALHLWTLIADYRTLPEDFRVWWSRWAREHRLPPPPTTRDP
jgi:hypothetical protein